jgi:hypothetical protein
MSSSQRLPGSREEDAWLSDEQLGQCSSADTEPFQSPVPTRMTASICRIRRPSSSTSSIGSGAGRKRREKARDQSPTVPRRHGRSEAFGKPFFKVNPVEMYEPAADAENGTPADVFVFDDQTHIVRSSGVGVHRGGLRPTPSMVPAETRLVSTNSAIPGRIGIREARSDRRSGYTPRNRGRRV